MNRLLLMLALLLSLPGHAHAAAPSWTGTWDTRWRESGARMELTQHGSQVRGAYPVYGGRIEGTVHGRTLTGQWIEGLRHGGVTFVLAPDGQSFMGRFDNGQWWTGSRSGAAQHAVQIDQSGAREALRTFLLAGNAARAGALDEIGAAAAIVDFGPAGATMVPGEKLAAASALFDLVDQTTVRLWDIPGKRAQGPALQLRLKQAGTGAELPLTLVQAPDRRWSIAMPGASDLATARRALLARSGGRVPPPDDYLRRRSPRDAMRVFAASFADWDGAGRAEALDALDLSEFSPATRGYEGELAAQYLNGIVARVGAVIPQEIPDDPSSRDPYLVLSHPAGDVVIAAHGTSPKTWQFTADTVRRSRDIYTAIEDMPAAKGSILPRPYSPYFRARRLIHDQAPGLLARIGVLEVWQILGVLVLLIAAFAIASLLGVALLAILRRLVGGREVPAERELGWPLRLALTFLLYRAFVPALGLPERASQVSVGVTGVLLALSVMWGGWKLIDALGDRFVKRGTGERGKLDDISVLLVLAALKITLLAGGLLFIASELSLPYGGVVAGLGIGGLAVAFASKETLSNVFGAALLAADRPFRRGDWITTSDVAGTVEHVGIRSTRIRTAADSLVFVPNGKLADATVNNLGTRRHRLFDLKPVLAYGTSAAQVEAFVAGLPDVVAGIVPAVPGRTQASVTNVTPEGIEIGLTCYLDTPISADELAAKTALTLGVLRLAERLGIVLGKRAPPTQAAA